MCPDIVMLHRVFCLCRYDIAYTSPANVYQNHIYETLTMPLLLFYYTLAVIWLMNHKPYLYICNSYYHSLYLILFRKKCLGSSSALLLMGFFPVLMLQRENCQASFWHAFAFFNDKWHDWKAAENCLLITVKLFKGADKAISKGACFHERHYRPVCSNRLKEHNFIKSCHLYLFRCKGLPDWCV